MNKRWALRAGVAAVAVTILYAIASVVVFDIALTPTREVCSSPTDDGVAAVPLALTSDDADRIALHGFMLSPAPAVRSDRAVVLVHGLDSCGWRGSHIELAKAYLKKGFTVVVFDLRAQGQSGGTHLGLGWHERADVRAAVQALRSRGFAPGKIGLHGTSFGAGIALLSAAALPEVGAVVADSAFADVRDLMSQELDRKVKAGFVFMPGVRIVARLRYGLDLAKIPPLVAVPKIAPRPIFFLHGTKDTRIPVEHAHRLKAASRGPDDQLWLLEGAGHTQGLSFDREQYLSRTTDFLATHPAY